MQTCKICGLAVLPPMYVGDVFMATCQGHAVYHPDSVLREVYSVDEIAMNKLAVQIELLRESVEKLVLIMGNKK